MFLLLEVDKGELGRGEPRTGPRNAGRGVKCAPFSQSLV